MIPKINSAHGSDTRNIINAAIDLINAQGKSIQELVAEGQLTPEQYENLIKTINGLISKGELSVDDIDINKGKLLPKHLSEEVLSMITGDAPINAVPADGSLTTRKYADKSITPGKTTFMTKTDNLFDGEYHGLLLSYYSNPGAMRYIKNPIQKTAVTPLEPNQTYTVKIHDPELNEAFRVAIANNEINFESDSSLIDLDKTILTNSQTIKELTFTNTSEGRYLLVNLGAIDSEPRLQIEKGNEATEYIEPFLVGTEIIDPELINRIDAWKQIQDVTYIENLFKGYLENTTLNNSNGNLAEDDKNVTSDEFIPVNHEYNYVVGTESIIGNNNSAKVAFYDENQIFIEITDWFQLINNTVLEAPSNARFVKFAVNNDHKDGFFVNVGTKPYYEVDDDVISSGFSEIIPSGVVEKKHLSKGVLDLINSGGQGVTGNQKPFPSKLRWETVVEDDSIKVASLSRDGKVIYATGVTRIMQSLDEGESWEYVTGGNPEQALAVRELDDGELLFTTKRRDTEDVKSKIYKTRGYDRHDLSNIVVEEVLEAKGVYADFNNSWGLDVHHNIVVASEYGQQGEDGARYAFLSTDFGNTWKEIFDQKNISETVPGAPSYTSDAHVHTIHYDRYRERIWVVVGDQANCATYYSDDLGVTWKVVPESTGIDAVQYTGITSYPEAVFFGSDRVPDGIYYWKDNGDKNDVRIKPFHLTVRKNNVRTLVYGLPYRRFNQKDEVTYFSASRDIIVNNEMSGIIVAFKGIHGAQVLYDFTDDDPNTTGVTACVGETAKGNLLASIKVGDSYKVIRAKAPIWE